MFYHVSFAESKRANASECVRGFVEVLPFLFEVVVVDDIPKWIEKEDSIMTLVFLE